MLTIALDRGLVHVGLDILLLDLGGSLLRGLGHILLKVPHGARLVRNAALEHAVRDQLGNHLVHGLVVDLDTLLTVHLRPNVGADHSHGDRVVLAKLGLLDQLDHSLHGATADGLLGASAQIGVTGLVLLEIDIVVRDHNTKHTVRGHLPLQTGLARVLGGQLQLELGTATLGGDLARDGLDGVLEGVRVEGLDGALTVVGLKLDGHIDVVAGVVLVLVGLDEAELELVLRLEVAVSLGLLRGATTEEVDGDGLHGDTLGDEDVVGGDHGVVELLSSGRVGQGQAGQDGENERRLHCCSIMWRLEEEKGGKSR